MREKDRLRYKIDELMQRWKRLTEIISGLQESSDLETRAEEKMRLKAQIAEKQQERQQIEGDIQALETQLTQQEIDVNINKIISDAQLATKNKAYSKALELWRSVLALSSGNQAAINAISTLQQQIQQQEKAKLLIQQLLERMADISIIFADVVKALNSPRSEAEAELISEYSQKFIF